MARRNMSMIASIDCVGWTHALRAEPEPLAAIVGLGFEARYQTLVASVDAVSSQLCQPRAAGPPAMRQEVLLPSKAQRMEDESEGCLGISQIVSIAVEVS